MVALIHGELVLALFELHVVGFGVGVLENFAHLHLVANRGRTLGVHVYKLGLLVDVVLTTPRCCAPWI